MEYKAILKPLASVLLLGGKAALKMYYPAQYAAAKEMWAKGKPQFENWAKRSTNEFDDKAIDIFDLILS